MSIMSMFCSRRGNWEFWFQRFKDFHVSDRERSADPLKPSHEELQAVFDENASETQKELSRQYKASILLASVN